LQFVRARGVCGTEGTFRVLKNFGLVTDCKAGLRAYFPREMSRPLSFLVTLLMMLAVSYTDAQQNNVGAPVSAPAAGQVTYPPQAAAPAAGQDAFSEAVTFDNFIKRAGIMAYPLIGLSMVAFFLIVLYSLTIRQGTVVSDAFMNSADALIRKQDYLGLLAVCNRRNEAIARITAKTLDFATRNPTASFEEVKEVTEAEGNRQSSLLLSRIAYLGDVGSVAPMLGLLGTTFGMITTFHEVSAKSFGGSNQLGLAEGVSEALLCTASGLIIGVPSLIFYAIFRGKVNRLISEMEAAMTHVMALLAVQYKRAARAASGAKAE
jgi:biopolymer transport protein ExbB